MIKLIDNLYLDADETFFLIFEWDGVSRHYDKMKTIFKKNENYYSSLDSAIDGLLKIQQRKAIRNSADLDSLLRELYIINDKMDYIKDRIKQ